MDCWKRLSKTKLATKKYFFNLRIEDITGEDYNHAKKSLQGCRIENSNWLS